MREAKHIFPGYGRAWSEEKAVGFWPRIAQRLREPATTADWTMAMAVCLPIGLLVGLFSIWMAL